jgi:hypothetical protein
MDAIESQRMSNTTGSLSSRSTGSGTGSIGSPRTQRYTGGWSVAAPSTVQAIPTSFASTHPYESSTASPSNTRDIANMMAASRTRALSSSLRANAAPPVFSGANTRPVYRSFPPEEYLTSRRYSSSVVSRR